MRVFLGITGASGLVYAERLLECMLAAGAQVELCVSKAAYQVAALEMAEPWPARPEALQAFFLARFPQHPGGLKVFGRENGLAPAASGFNPPDAVVIFPCTTGSLAAIAQGLADALIERAVGIQDLVDFVVARILDHLQLQHGLMPRWGERA
ncbi:MAG: flavoprotein [Halothiobacillaceae bacterium]